MNNYEVKARSTYESQRKQKQFGENRVCSDKNCETTLSKYNKKETCFNHSPKEFGRNRGWKDPSTKIS